MLDQSKGACSSCDPIIESGILFRAMNMDLNSFWMSRNDIKIRPP